MLPLFIIDNVNDDDRQNLYDIYTRYEICYADNQS